MKRIFHWCVLTLIMLAAASFSAAQKNASTETAVADLEQQWLKSQQTNDVSLAEPLLADKIVDTERDGRGFGKARILGASKATKYSSAEYYDVKVTVFGNTAIATGGFKGKGTDASGKAFDTNVR